MTNEANNPTLVDLFSGAGGFTLGFVNNGFRSIFAVDNDGDAAETYNINFGRHCVHGDINDIKTFPEADVVIGGPPCQGFSNLGARLPNDPRNQLWRHYVRAVEIVRPKVFVVENVPPLLKSAEGQEMIEETRELGYEVEGRILNAADYGAYQTRKRTIIIGSRVGPVKFPLQTHIDPSKRNGNGKGRTNNLFAWAGEEFDELVLKDWATVRDAIGDLPRKPTGENLHIGRNPTKMSMERYRHIPPGGNRWDLPEDLMPECWRKKTKGGTDLFGRLWWDRPSVTIRTEFYKPEKGRYLHPEEDRPITHREAARIQGFPDDFHFFGSKISIARQIGNAVPVQLADSIAKAVLEMITNAETV